MTTLCFEPRLVMDGPTSGFAWLADESAALRNFSDAERAQMAEAELRNFPQPEQDSAIWRYLETYKFEDLLKTETLYLRQKGVSPGYWIILISGPVF